MASSRHLAKLKEGAKAWNDWRRAEHSVRPDLQGLALTLGEKQWGETNGGPIDFSRANLRGAKLRHATLVKADLSEASLAEADLSGARLLRADLRNTDLSNASLDEADLQDAMLDGADLSGADLRGARNLKQAQFAQTRGNDKTQLPSGIRAPRVWAADDAGPRRLDFFKPQDPVAEEKPVFSGMFAKSAPVPAVAPAATSAVASAAPQRTSWVSRFGKSAEAKPSPAEPGKDASWITSSAAKPAGQKPAIETSFTAKPAEPAPGVSSLFSSTPEPRKETAPAATGAGGTFLTLGELPTSLDSPGPAAGIATEPKLSIAAAAAAQVGRAGSALRASAASFSMRLARLRPAKVLPAEIIPPAMPEFAAGHANADAELDSEPDAIAPAAPHMTETSVRMAEALAASAPADERESSAAHSALDDFVPAVRDARGEAATHEEDFDPRWLAQMAREAGATPVEQLIARGRSLARGTAQVVSGALALLNPLRAAARMRKRRAGMHALEAPSSAPVEAILEPHFPKTETIVLRTLDPASATDGGSALVAVTSTPARSRWRSTPVQIAAAAVFAFALVGAAVQFGGVHQFGSVTLYENLPLSGVAEAGERVPAPVAAPRRQPDAGAPREAARAAAHEAPTTQAGGTQAHGTQARGTQVALASTAEPGVATDASIATGASNATDAGPAIANARRPAAEKPTTFAQAGVRTHGEIATPADANDPATPLVGAPAAPSRLPAVPYGVVLTPGPSAAANPAPAAETAPAPAPAAQAPADDPAATKLGFAGQDLSALAKAKKPPATVIEYMQEPVHSTEWVTTLIKKFYLSSAPLSPAEIKALYAEPLEHYFGEKGVSLDRVAQEKADYYKEWPKRSYKLVPGSLKVDWVSEGVAEVSFLYDFTVSAPDKEPNKGRGRANLTLDITEAPGRITREDGEVLGAE
jgi:hypothetical protein